MPERTKKSNGLIIGMLIGSLAGVITGAIVTGIASRYAGRVWIKVTQRDKTKQVDPRWLLQ